MIVHSGFETIQYSMGAVNVAKRLSDGIGEI